MMRLNQANQGGKNIISQGSMFKGPEAGQGLPCVGKSVRNLNRESNILSEHAEKLGSCCHGKIMMTCRVNR